MIIRSYQPGDRDAAVEILTSAFAADPAFARITDLAVSSDTRRVLEDLFRLQITHEYEPAGVIDIAEETGKILGVALWTPPAQGETGAQQRMSAARGYAKLFGPHVFALYRRERELGACHPRFPHWYLYTLAVSPAAQGKGVGSRLLRAGMERANRQAVYLEASTPRSARLYAGLGFVPLGELPRHGAGPSELAMWLPPSLPEA